MYILSVFISAFLLFQVQPLMGKLLLPWFGGAPAVWSTLILFFQMLLTGGYAYAYGLIGIKDRKKQAVVHTLVIGLSVVLLVFLASMWPSPITPGADWKPAGIERPILQIFKLLALSVGLPYFALATNSTLVQVWFNRRHPNKSPYWLYAFSNTGSLLALVTYPLLIEPAFTLRAQGSIWAAAYLVFVLITLFILHRKREAEPAAGRRDAPAGMPANAAKPSWTSQGLWVALSATASILLLAVTNQMTLDVPPIPFLWVIPLSLYLSSFILAFSGEGRYHRPFFSLLLAVSSVGVMLVVLLPTLGFVPQIAIYSLFMFAAFMAAHGELYRLRPAAVYLSRFYLLISIGGALGGLMVNLVAPAVFSSYWEFYLGWGLLLILMVVMTYVRKTHELRKPWAFYHDVLVGGLAVGVVVFSGFIVNIISTGNQFFDRNFFGVVRISYDEETDAHQMFSGTTLHGFQYLDAQKRDIPTAYYWTGSGIGQLFRHHPRPTGKLKVGLLGLGAGTLSAYGQPGDEFRYYEINPMVVDLANGAGGYFSFVSDSAAEVTVVLGDARISLENELIQGTRQEFDILVIDTFSGDSIPVHLITKEAFELYLDHLAPDGVIALHISNRYLDLQPVVRRLTTQFGLYAGVIQTAPPPEDAPAARASTWVLVAEHSDIFEIPEIALSIDRLEGSAAAIPLWTDEYSNLIQIIQ